MHISKAEKKVRERLASNGRNPANNNAGIRVGSDLHLCEMLLAEIDRLRTVRPWNQAECEELKRYLPDLVKNAMLVAWREICADTGCHPLDIEHGRGKYLIFEPRHWAQMAGEIVTSQVERFWADQASYADLRESGGIGEAP